MRLAVTILAVAILIVVPIALAIPTEVVSLAAPPRLGAIHPSQPFATPLLAAARPTAMRAPPLAG